MPRAFLRAHARPRLDAASQPGRGTYYHGASPASSVAKGCGASLKSTRLPRYRASRASFSRNGNWLRAVFLGGASPTAGQKVHCCTSPQGFMRSCTKQNCLNSCRRLCSAGAKLAHFQSKQSRKGGLWLAGQPTYPLQFREGHQLGVDYSIAPTPAVSPSNDGSSWGLATMQPFESGLGSYPSATLNNNQIRAKFHEEQGMTIGLMTAVDAWQLCGSNTLYPSSLSTKDEPKPGDRAHPS